MLNISIILSCVFIASVLTTLSAHIFHGSYLWEYSKPVFYFVWRIYMRIEYAIMIIVYKIGSGWLVTHSTFFRKFLVKMISIAADGEVYTLEECYKIIDILYKDYPHVYVGMRLCCCRHSMGYYDDEISNVTDLTFVYSDKPGLKKRMGYTKFISLDEAKRLLKKFDNEGFVHTMFGACARFIDGSINLSICNCMRRRDGKGSGCIPLTLAMEHESFLFHKPHNIAIIDPSKCVGVEECGECIPFCNFDARIVDKSNGKIKIITDKCQGCGLCLSHCPEAASTIKYLPENKAWFYQNMFKKLQKRYKKIPEDKRPSRIPKVMEYNK